MVPAHGPAVVQVERHGPSMLDTGCSMLVDTGFRSMMLVCFYRVSSIEYPPLLEPSNPHSQTAGESHGDS
jgi:hypothetical protein